jgi:hypothetical protein
MSEGAAIMEQFQRLLQEDAPLTLTNVYKEVPIVHNARICDVRGEHLVLETDELQIPAMHWSGSTVINSPSLPNPIEAQVDSSDIRLRQVTLSRFRNTDLPSRQRTTVRVRLKKPVRLALITEAAQIAGVIHDISLGGCLIRTGRSRLEPGDLLVELDLDGQRLQIPATVLRVEGEEPCFQCAVVFKHSQETEQLTSSFIHRREHEIIKELQTGW